MVTKFSEWVVYEGTNDTDNAYVTGFVHDSAGRAILYTDEYTVRIRGMAFGPGPNRWISASSASWGWRNYRIALYVAYSITPTARDPAENRYLSIVPGTWTGNAALETEAGFSRSSITSVHRASSTAGTFYSSATTPTAYSALTLKARPDTNIRKAIEAVGFHAFGPSVAYKYSSIGGPLNSAYYHNGPRGVRIDRDDQTPLQFVQLVQLDSTTLADISSLVGLTRGVTGAAIADGELSATMRFDGHVVTHDTVTDKRSEPGPLDPPVEGDDNYAFLDQYLAEYGNIRSADVTRTPPTPVPELPASRRLTNALSQALAQPTALSPQHASAIGARGSDPFLITLAALASWRAVPVTAGQKLQWGWRVKGLISTIGGAAIVAEYGDDALRAAWWAIRNLDVSLRDDAEIPDDLEEVCKYVVDNPDFNVMQLAEECRALIDRLEGDAEELPSGPTPTPEHDDNPSNRE